MVAPDTDDPAFKRQLEIVFLKLDEGLKQKIAMIITGSIQRVAG